MFRSLKVLLTVFAFGLVLTTSAVLAQETPPPAANDQADGLPAGMFDPAGDFGGFGGLPGAETDDDMELSGELMVERGTRKGVLRVNGKPPLGWHVYAIDQDGGPGPAKITVNPAAGFKVTGPFRADREPEERKVEWFDVPLREHYGEVNWSAPVEIGDGIDPASIQWDIKFDGQICNDAVGCRPIFEQSIPVKFAGYRDEETPPANDDGSDTPAEMVVPPAESAEPSETPQVEDAYRAARAYVMFTGAAQPVQVAPGGTFQISLTAVCDEDWHIYAYAPQDPEEVAKPTLIVIQQPAGWTMGTPAASSEPTVEEFLQDEAPIRYHDGTVTWTVPVTVPDGTQEGEYEVVGLLGYQTCTHSGCDRPLGAEFRVPIQVGTGISDNRLALQFTQASYAQAARLAAAPGADDVPLVTADGTGVATADAAVEEVVQGEEGPTAPAVVADGKEEYSFVAMLGFAFLGGLILNVMPCVFPVIGLKIMAFVQQAGEDRGRVFMLNVWYSLGMILVFLVLAILAIVMNLGWGEQFNNQIFSIAMTAVVFAMGLSMLGVWEIPIPGFVGSGTANELSESEGPAGAVFKGILTTILATPCSGPGLAIALGYCQGKPASVVFPLFLTVGVGMASPYLLIGAFPQLLRFLPRPGQWMETFKQVMGFVLMGTAVYLLTFLSWTNVLPTITLLVGLGLACWFVGRAPVTADFQVKLRAWLIGGAFAVLIGMYAFGGTSKVGGINLHGLQATMEHRLERDVDAMLAAREDSLPGSGVVDPLLAAEATDHTGAIRWHAFTRSRLERLTAANRTVLVDFTADWCPTCKWLETTVLETDDVRRVLRENTVVTLVADWSNKSPEIASMLESLGSKQIPVVAIYPAGSSDPPIVLKGGYTKATLLEKLNEAGPSIQDDQASNPRVAAN